MEKFIKENWFKLGILFIILLIGATLWLRYDTYLDNLLNRDTQITCSKAAAIWYKEQNGDSSRNTSSGYENHFNPKLNKCFATQSTSVNSGKDYMVSFFVYDVYENRLIMERHTWLSGSPPDVYIKDDLYGGGSSITKDEFGNLFKLYMEN